MTASWVGEGIVIQETGAGLGVAVGLGGGVAVGAGVDVGGRVGVGVGGRLLAWAFETKTNSGNEAVTKSLVNQTHRLKLIISLHLVCSPPAQEHRQVLDA